MSEIEMMREEAEAKPAFVVDNDSKAERCLKKISEKRQEMETWKRHYEMLYSTIEQELNSEIEYFSAQLEQYLRRQRDAGFTKAAKTQISYKLPSGKLVLKKQEPEYERNNDTLIDWLKKNDAGMVKVKEEVDWQGLKKKLVPLAGRMVTEDGEVVPGITVIPRPDKFTVEVK